MDINLGLSAVATGVDTITATYSPAPTLVDKKILFLRTAGTNTITAPTFSPNGLTAHTITKNNGDALAVGDLDGDVILMYDLSNTNWELLTPKVVGGSQTLAQVLSTDNKTGAQNIVSNNGKSVIGVLDAVINIEHTDAPFAGGFSVDPSIIQINWNDGTAFSDIRADATSMRLRHSQAIYNYYGLTADTIASFDASSNLVGLDTATYPDLTELSYVKGVTSAIQTQLGNKADTSNVPILEVMTGASSLFNPLDGTTTYIGPVTTLAPTGTATNRQFTLPTGTIKSAWFFVDPTSAVGSNEAVTYYLRNITDATSTLLGTLTYDVRGNASLTTGLSIATNSSKLYSIEIVNPTFATNPTNCFITTKLIIYP